MITFPMMPSVDVNIFLLVFIGFGAGILSGFAGVGGAFVVTPALIILGFPANLAVGTSLAWVMGNSIVGTLRHRKLGNVDMKLGLVLLIGAMCGMEIGVRILNWSRNIGLADEVVLSISICILLMVGFYMLSESVRRKRYLDKMLERKEDLLLAMGATSLSQRIQSIRIPPMLQFTKSEITMSLWILLVAGFFIGILAGLVGVGGGFIMVPSLVYLVGIPSFMAVGTDLFQIIFSAAYGTIRHTMSGNVIIFAALIMVVASSIGVQFGVLVTNYVRGVSVRIVLGISILIFAAGTILRLLNILLGKETIWLKIGSLAVTFGGMGVAVMLILTLCIIGFRYNSGKYIPVFLKSFVTKDV